jgi:hypothetical protein
MEETQSGDAIVGIKRNGELEPLPTKPDTLVININKVLELKDDEKKIVMSLIDSLPNSLAYETLKAHGYLIKSRSLKINKITESI